LIGYLRGKTFKDKIFKSGGIVLWVHAGNGRPFNNRAEKMLYFLLLVIVCEDVDNRDDVDATLVIGDNTLSEFLRCQNIPTRSYFVDRDFDPIWIVICLLNFPCQHFEVFIPCFL